MTKAAKDEELERMKARIEELEHLSRALSMMLVRGGVISTANLKVLKNRFPFLQSE